MPLWTSWKAGTENKSLRSGFFYGLEKLMIYAQITNCFQPGKRL